MTSGDNENAIARVAVSAARYWVDRPYDYLIPDELRGMVKPGARVVVPFARGNKRSEAVILALTEKSARQGLKVIDSVLDDSPVLTPEQLKLALWMRERFFCTVYAAVRAMLPAGLWYDLDEDGGKRRVGDKLVSFASLDIPAEEAEVLAGAKRRRAPMQSAVLGLLAEIGRAPVREICRFTGAGASSVTALAEAGLVRIDTEEVFRRPDYETGERAELPELNGGQSKAFEGILELAESPEPKAALLFGVTGSGKTPVYIRLIDETLKRGKTAILLVPEIALTPQMLRTFSSHFGESIAVLHSSLPVGERYDEWKRIKSGDARLVIGTRSAVFAPVSDLGLIVIDEEQEGSYKSENEPRYHARDIAKYRCAYSSALLLLGSATPDIESRYNADSGRYAYFTLPDRYNEMKLPDVEIVDMKRELRMGNGGCISSVLRDEMASNIKNGRQSILFLNRRGANRFVTCVDCGYTFTCPRCSVSLTYHSANRRQMCHYCGYSRKIDEECPDCGGTLRFDGAGTQKVVEELGELFPGVAVLRMDTDTVRPAGSHSSLLNRFREERIPIMVGTQMVTKGLNFENVTLVGVISADQSLTAGDYRAAEHTFSLITQVVGRSGRGEAPGRAVIQTFTPQNQTILQAAKQDYDGFYASEIELRRSQSSPPFTELYVITASGLDETAVLRAMTWVRDTLRRELSSCEGTRVLGPAPLPVVKVKDRFRHRVTLATPEGGKDIRALVSAVVTSCNTDKVFRGVSVFADINPSF